MPLKHHLQLLTSPRLRIKNKGNLFITGIILSNDPALFYLLKASVGFFGKLLILNTVIIYGYIRIINPLIFIRYFLITVPVDHPDLINKYLPLGRFIFRISKTVNQILTCVSCKEQPLPFSMGYLF